MLTTWNPADFFNNEQAINAYLTAAAESGDLVLIAAALGDVAKACGIGLMAELAPFDPAEYLTAHEDQAAIIADAFATGDDDTIDSAIELVDRARAIAADRVHYYGVVHGEQASAFGVHFPDLPGCYSAADHADDVVRLAARAIALWREDNPLPQPSDLAAIKAVAATDLAEGAFLVRVPCPTRSRPAPPPDQPR